MLHKDIFFLTSLSYYFRLRSVETAIGLMKNLQTSIVVEETWVEKHTDILNAQPTAINAKLLDVSTLININHKRI